MLGKITGAMIRREADAYLAQGLHEEALALFKKSIRSDLKLPSDVRTAIEEQIQCIEAEMAGTASEGEEELSEGQIAVIKEGWRGEASVEDLAVSAHALHAMGCYSNALEEFATLIQRGYSAHRLLNPMAACLVRLNPPQDILETVDRLAAGLFPDPKSNFAFKLSLAEEMIKGRFNEHAHALSLHLVQYSGMPASYRVRMEALIKNLKALPRQTLPQAPKRDRVPGAAAGPPSVIQRLRGVVEGLAARMRSPKNRP